MAREIFGSFATIAYEVLDNLAKADKAAASAMEAVGRAQGSPPEHAAAMGWYTPKELVTPFHRKIFLLKARGELCDVGLPTGVRDI